MYSGLFKHVNQEMQDNAKVRIERMSIPSLIQFCMAKEWISAPVIEQKAFINEEQISALNEKLQANNKPEQLPIPVQPIESEMDKRIKLMELISKLIN